MIADALLFATAAHAAVGQTRKYTGEPYVTHPIAVAEIVKTVPHDDAMIAAALLHDVVEDTKVTVDLLAEVFGEDVARLVSWLTAVGGPGNRAARKAADRDLLARAPARAQTIKVADLIHNTESIVARDPKFAPVYLAEKRALLEVLTAADPTLLARAWAQVMPPGELWPKTRCPDCDAALQGWQGHSIAAGLLPSVTYACGHVFKGEGLAEALRERPDEGETALIAPPPLPRSSAHQGG